MNATLLCCAIALLSSMSALASDAYRQRMYSMRDGLGHDYVYCALQGRAGFMWFGTRDGLSRFDGHAFKTYRWRKGDTASLPDNVVDCLAQDRSGSIWVGTRMGGLACLDPRTGRVRRVRVPGHPDHGSQRPILGLCIDSSNAVWVRTSSSNVYRLDQSTGRWTSISGIRSVRFNERSIMRMVTAPNGDVWTLSSDGPCYVRAGDTVFSNGLVDPHQILAQRRASRTFDLTALTATRSGLILYAIRDTVIVQHADDPRRQRIYALDQRTVCNVVAITRDGMWTGPIEIDTSASQYLCNKMKGDDNERTAQGI